MPYTPHTREEIQAMLAQLGVPAVEDLFAELPDELRAHAGLNLPPGQSEMEVVGRLQRLADLDLAHDHTPSFLGAGCYDHYIPALVPFLCSRAEFATSYTPYQPEASQGTLQVIYEFQSLMCDLTGMEVANASLYDGATALAEGVFVITAVAKPERVLVAESVSPIYRQVLATYTRHAGVQVELVHCHEGTVDLNHLAELTREPFAAAVVQNPNFFGCLENCAAVSELVHERGGRLIAVVEPLSLALVETPGEYGADLAVAEGQPLGLTESLGGPGLGIMTAKRDLLRRLPGRLAGATHDTHGRRGFVLTLQTREQHIRREKATSNICSNQGLCALAATIYLSVLGPGGLRAVAATCVQKAHYAQRRLSELNGFAPAFSAPFLYEFAVTCPTPVRQLNARLKEAGIIGGYDLSRDYASLSNTMLLCVTETRRRHEIDHLIGTLAEIASAEVEA